MYMAVLAEGRFDKAGFQNGSPFSIQKSIPAEGRLCKTKTKRFGSQSNPCGKMTLAVVLAPRLQRRPLFKSHYLIQSGTTIFRA